MTLILQCSYYFLTGLWPFLDYHTFETVTGPKTDIWLVKTVAAQLISTSVFLAVTIYRKRFRSAALLGLLSAIAIGISETSFALKNIISDIYLVDAMLELLFTSTYASALILAYNSPKV